MCGGGGGGGGGGLDKPYSLSTGEEHVHIDGLHHFLIALQGVSRDILSHIIIAPLLLVTPELENTQMLLEKLQTSTNIADHVRQPNLVPPDERRANHENKCSFVTVF